MGVGASTSAAKGGKSEAGTGQTAVAAQTAVATTYAVKVLKSGRAATARAVVPMTEAEFAEAFGKAMQAVAAATTPHHLTEACVGVTPDVIHLFSRAQIINAVAALDAALDTVDPANSDASVAALRVVAKGGSKAAMAKLIQKLTAVRRSSSGYPRAHDAVAHLKTQLAVQLSALHKTEGGTGQTGAGAVAGGANNSKTICNRHRRGLLAKDVMTDAAKALLRGETVGNGAARDAHRNLLGKEFDLGKDGAFDGQTVLLLVGNEYLEASGETPVVPLVRSKGFTVRRCVKRYLTVVIVLLCIVLLCIVLLCIVLVSCTNLCNVPIAMHQSVQCTNCNVPIAMHALCCI